MVDVSEKAVTERTAIAESFVYLGTEIMSAFAEAGWSCKKGPILDTAIIAAAASKDRTTDD